MTGRQRRTRSGTDPVDILRGQRGQRQAACRNKYTVTSNGRRNMTVAESKSLKQGIRVYWRGDANDSGRITAISWDAVTIAWDNGQVATVHHGDMREIQRVPARRGT
jgi:hypothetical protein